MPDKDGGKWNGAKLPSNPPSEQGPAATTIHISSKEDKVVMSPARPAPIFESIKMKENEPKAEVTCPKDVSMSELLF